MIVWEFPCESRTLPGLYYRDVTYRVKLKPHAIAWGFFFGYPNVFEI